MCCCLPGISSHREHLKAMSVLKAACPDAQNRIATPHSICRGKALIYPCCHVHVDWATLYSPVQNRCVCIYIYIYIYIYIQMYYTYIMHHPNTPKPTVTPTPHAPTPLLPPPGTRGCGHGLEIGGVLVLE
jgi:hypothetical protein